MLHSFRLLAIILLSVTVLSGSMLCSAHAAAQPTVRLTSVDYSKVILPGTAFQVKVNAWYSDTFLSDIGIWDVNSELIVQSMTFISQFAGPGNVSFTLTLTAPKTPGPWRLLAINRVWWQNAWFQDPRGGEESFTVTGARWERAHKFRWAVIYTKSKTARMSPHPSSQEYTSWLLRWSFNRFLASVVSSWVGVTV
jgi:hypothetical protein